ncbi:MAG TPA: RlmE family RNA methyltransferase [Mariprofundaceae bacterium]|nr:RlmE family RNA methyltransferase [Mariprofundaceae bacterium]
MKKSKAGRKTSAWFQRHANDAHVKQAQKEGKRSRAAFKLTEILDKHGLMLKPDSVVVDLGCAPGSWSAEIANRVGPEGLVVGIDLLELQPIRGVHLIQADFDSPKGLKAIDAVLGERKANLVLSDMAPEMSGNKLVDQARMMHLNDMTLNFAVNHLRQGGHLLLKSFMGDGFDAFRKELAGWFAKVKIVKPAASRKTSAEMFLLAEGFRG